MGRDSQWKCSAPGHERNARHGAAPPGENHATAQRRHVRKETMKDEERPRKTGKDLEIFQEENDDPDVRSS
jgi:hypothetical protein